MVWSDQLKQLWGNLLALGPRRLAALGLVGFTVFLAVGLGSYFSEPARLRDFVRGA